ncbi:MAG: hypothetical protein GC185_10460 [Alphaproteobacteria bacterium]|nr:hypothetical protein [Alphaproteobacteria bacterium]
MAKPEKKTAVINEAVGIFSDADSLQSAVDELEVNGFTRSQISVLSDAKTVEKKLGHLYKRVEDAEDNPDTPRTIFVPAGTIHEAQGALIGAPLYIAGVTGTAIVVATGGPLLAAILAATGGAAIGAVMAGLVAKHHADYIQYQLDRGGLLLWVSLRDAGHEKLAVEILKKNAARDVHVHQLPIDSLWAMG